MKILICVLLVLIALAVLVAAAAVVYCAITLHSSEWQRRRLKQYQPPEVARNGEGRRLKERV